MPHISSSHMMTAGGLSCMAMLCAASVAVCSYGIQQVKLLDALQAILRLLLQYVCCCVMTLQQHPHATDLCAARRCAAALTHM
jgi:hypothetical protein